MNKCLKCEDGCEGKVYIDPKSKVEKHNLCQNCYFGRNGHKKYAKPMYLERKI